MTPDPCAALRRGQAGVLPCRMGPASYHLEDATVVRYEPMVSTAWEMRTHWVDRTYRYTVATKGVLDAKDQEIEVSDDNREVRSRGSEARTRRTCSGCYAAAAAAEEEVANPGQWA